MRSLKVFANDDEAVRFCLDHFIQNATEALSKRGIFTVALSGGSTPKLFFDRLSSSEQAKALDWKHIVLFWSDERACPPDHPDSNYGMAMKILSHEPFSCAQAFRMQAEEDDRDNAAREYEALIKKYCPEGRLDIVYLGVGEDGHTASLFPHSPALDEKKRLVIVTFVEVKMSWRMTLTFPCINQARNIVVLALGAKKAPIIKHTFNDKEILYPIQRVGTEKTPALFICDREAAPK